MNLRALALAALLVAATFAPASAQDAQPAAPAAPATTTPPPAPTFTPEHLAAAVEFLTVSGATRGFEDLIPQYLDRVRVGYVSRRPEIGQIINDASFSLIPEFVKRRDDLNASLATLYAAKFSIEELKQLAAFYKTPLGQKLSAGQVEILQQSVPVVDRWSREISNEMARRIVEEVAKKGQKL